MKLLNDSYYYYIFEFTFKKIHENHNLYCKLVC